MVAVMIKYVFSLQLFVCTYLLRGPAYLHCKILENESRQFVIALDQKQNITETQLGYLHLKLFDRSMRTIKQ